MKKVRYTLALMFLLTVLFFVLWGTDILKGSSDLEGTWIHPPAKCWFVVGPSDGTQTTVWIRVNGGIWAPALMDVADARNFLQSANWQKTAAPREKIR